MQLDCGEVRFSARLSSLALQLTQTSYEKNSMLRAIAKTGTLNKQATTTYRLFCELLSAGIAMLCYAVLGNIPLYHHHPLTLPLVNIPTPHLRANE